MLASPPPFRYSPREPEDSPSNDSAPSMPSGTARRPKQHRPYTSTGATSSNLSISVHVDGSEPRHDSMASSSTVRKATTSQLRFPVPAAPSSPPPWVPASVQECFVTRNGRKLHAFHVSKAPYPLCYDREFLDL